MDERELIKKIKELKQVKPSQDWVLFTKNRIFGGEKKYPSLLFTPIRKPALIVAPLVVVAAVLGGLFVYFNFIPQAQSPVITQGEQKPAEIARAVEELQKNLESITLKLNNLKKAKDSTQALVLAEIIKSTAKNGEKIASQNKSLASLGNAYRELEQEATQTQIEMMGDLIKDLKGRTLSKEDQERLEKATKYYNQGKYSEAMILIQQIGK